MGSRPVSKKKNRSKNTVGASNEVADTAEQKMRANAASMEPLTDADYEHQGFLLSVSRVLVQLVLTFIVVSILLHFGVMFAVSESQHAFDSFKGNDAVNPDVQINKLLATQAVAASFGALIPGVLIIPVWRGIGRAFKAMIIFVRKRSDMNAVVRAERKEKAATLRAERGERRRRLKEEKLNKTDDDILGDVRTQDKVSE